MEIINKSSYEELAATYQCLEIARLNEVLKKNGIDGKELREKICGEFIFNSGNFIDSGFFVAEGIKVHPEICFSERSFNEDEGLGEIEKLHIASDYFAFHEYAFGDIGWYFEEHNESVDEIECGNY
jgi:hypothetical protein